MGQAQAVGSERTRAGALHHQSRRPLGARTPIRWVLGAPVAKNGGSARAGVGVGVARCQGERSAGVAGGAGGAVGRGGEQERPGLAAARRPVAGLAGLARLARRRRAHRERSWRAAAARAVRAGRALGAQQGHRRPADLVAHDGQATGSNRRCLAGRRYRPGCEPAQLRDRPRRPAGTLARGGGHHPVHPRRGRSRVAGQLRAVQRCRASCTQRWDDVRLATLALARPAPSLTPGSASLLPKSRWEPGISGAQVRGSGAKLRTARRAALT